MVRRNRAPCIFGCLPHPTFNQVGLGRSPNLYSHHKSLKGRMPSLGSPQDSVSRQLMVSTALRPLRGNSHDGCKDEERSSVHAR